MSITSGPIVPFKRGTVTGAVPSENVSVALWSVIVRPSKDQSSVGATLLYRSFSCVSQLLEQRTHRRIGGLGASGDQIPQLVVRQREQLVERRDLFFRKRCAFGIQKPGQDQIVFEQSTPTAPANPRKAARVNHGHRKGSHRAFDHEVLDLADRRRWIQPFR